MPEKEWPLPQNTDGPLFVSGDREELKEILKIRKPNSTHPTKPETERETAPSTLNFTRTREVGLLWEKLIDKKKLISNPHLAIFKRILEDSWGSNPFETSSSGKESIQMSSIMIKVGAYHKFQYGNAFNNNEWGPEEVPDGEWVFKHGNMDRYYWAVKKKGDTELELDKDLKAYEKAWSSRIDHLELVHDGNEKKQFDTGNDGFYMRSEEIDLSIPAIIKEYEELMILKGIYEKTSKAADKIPDNIETNQINLDEIGPLLNKYCDLKLPLAKIESARQKLHNRAKQLGYYLALKNDTIQTNSTPEESKNIIEGKLYKRFEKTTEWTEWVDSAQVYKPHNFSKDFRFEDVVDNFVNPISNVLEIGIGDLTGGIGGIFGRGNRTGRARMPIQHSQKYIDYEEVDLDLGPLEKKRNELTEKGHHCYVFELKDTGYVTASGYDIRQVMFDCNADEEFRRKCVVFIPVYEQKLLGGMIKTKYIAIRRPVPGVLPVSPPRLFIEESLSYKTRWLGTELGPVMHSINLAPGETRNIKVVKLNKKGPAGISNVTSVLDTTSTKPAELSSLIIQEMLKGGETACLNTWNVKASGNVGYAQGGAEAGGNSTKTSREFALQFQDIARKAAISHNENMSEELSASFDDSDAGAGEVRNVNEGRSLNLFFYHLKNIIEGSICLEDMALVVLPGTELIAGSGIQLPLTFRLGQIEDCLAALSPGRYFCDYYQVDKKKLLLEILQAIQMTLLHEYADGETRKQIKFISDGDNEMPVSLEVVSIKLDKEEKEIVKAAFVPMEMEEKMKEVYSFKEGELDDILEKNIKSLKAILEKLSIKKGPMNTQIFHMPSGAFYLDALVGTQSVEGQYSEHLKAAKIRSRDSGTEVKKARAALDNARAIDIRRGRMGQHQDGIYQLKNPVMTEVSRFSRDSILIKLSAPLPDGEWILSYRGKKTEIDSIFESREAIKNKSATIKEWLEDWDSMELRIVELKTGMYIEH